MGGNALLYAKTGRKTAEEFTGIVKDVCDRLSKLFPVTRFAPVKSYHQKETFGDADILFESQFLPDNWIDLVRLEFLPDEMYINRLKGTAYRVIKPSMAPDVPDLHTGKHYAVPPGPIPCSSVSFDYDGFQIDLIITQPGHFEIAQVYYAYNDLGNLMGRVADRMGLKYGWNGLWCKLAEGTEVYATEMVSMNPERIFAFLGYDYKRFKLGFETLENMFEFAASSPYFHRQLYLLENRNHRDRVRDEKRSSYTAFLKWLEGKPWLDKYTWVREPLGEICPHREREKAIWLQRAREEFHAFDERVAEAKSQLEYARRAKLKWNGALVNRLTGLQGKALGDFMRAAQEHKQVTSFPKPFNQAICEMEDAEIEAFILAQYGQAQS